MQRIIHRCIFVLFLLAAVPAGAWDKVHPVCFPAPRGITDWWPGDGNGADIVGGRTATFVDNATTSPGLVGKAFTLDGDGDFIEIPTDPGLDFGRKDFTILLWVKFNSLVGEQVVIEKWVQPSGFEAPRGWTLTKLEDNSIRLALGALGSGGEFGVNSQPLNLPENVWMQVAARRVGNRFSILLNGEEIAFRIADVPMPFIVRSVSSLKFGHRCSPADTPGCADDRGFFLNGQIDEVQLFNGRALPRGLIRAIYLAGARGECKKLCADGRYDDEGSPHEDEGGHEWWRDAGN